MFRFRLSVFVSAVLISAPLNAATATRKDPSALAVIQAAIIAMGGDTALVGIKDSVVKGMVVSDSGKTTPFVWKTASGEFRYEVQTVKGTQVLVSGHGKPAMLRNGKITPVFFHVADGVAPFHLPAILLAGKIADPTISLIDSGTKSLLSKPVFTVQVRSDVSVEVANITTQTWYVDENSGLPLRVDYRLPELNSINAWVDLAAEFSDYRPVAGLLVPFTIRCTETGAVPRTVTITSIDFNVGVDPTEFDLSGGAQ